MIAVILISVVVALAMVAMAVGAIFSKRAAPRSSWRLGESVQPRLSSLSP